MKSDASTGSPKSSHHPHPNDHPTREWPNECSYVAIRHCQTTCFVKVLPSRPSRMRAWTTHMESSGKWSRRASTQKRFWNQFVSKILSLRRILYSAGPLSWSHPPSSVDNVKKFLTNIGRSRRNSRPSSYSRTHVGSEVSQTTCLTDLIKIVRPIKAVI